MTRYRPTKRLTVGERCYEWLQESKLPIPESGITQPLDGLTWAALRDLINAYVRDDAPMSQSDKDAVRLEIKNGMVVIQKKEK